MCQHCQIKSKIDFCVCVRFAVVHAWKNCLLFCFSSAQAGDLWFQRAPLKQWRHELHLLHLSSDGCHVRLQWVFMWISTPLSPFLLHYVSFALFSSLPLSLSLSLLILPLSFFLSLFLSLSSVCLSVCLPLSLFYACLCVCVCVCVCLCVCVCVSVFRK